MAASRRGTRNPSGKAADRPAARRKELPPSTCGGSVADPAQSGAADRARAGMLFGCPTRSDGSEEQ